MVGLNVYTLTPYTGRKANEERTMSISVFAVRPKVFFTVLGAAGVGIVVALISSVVLKAYAVLVFFAVAALTAWVILGVTPDDRQLPRYKAFVDAHKGKSTNGKFFIGVNPVNPLATQDLLVANSTKPKDTPSRPITGVFHSGGREFEKLTRVK